MKIADFIPGVQPITDTCRAKFSFSCYARATQEHRMHDRAHFVKNDIIDKTEST